MPLVILLLRPILDDTFDNAFENSSEEFEINRSVRVKQESACKAMGVLRRLLSKI
jgi:hypothetical protein